MRIMESPFIGSHIKSQGLQSKERLKGINVQLKLWPNSMDAAKRFGDESLIHFISRRKITKYEYAARILEKWSKEVRSGGLGCVS